MLCAWEWVLVSRGEMHNRAVNQAKKCHPRMIRKDVEPLRLPVEEDTGANTNELTWKPECLEC